MFLLLYHSNNDNDDDDDDDDVLTHSLTLTHSPWILEEKNLGF